jgi:transposase
LVQRLNKQEQKSIREIGRTLGLAPSTIQDLLDNYRGSGQRRPRATKQAPATTGNESPGTNGDS